MAARVRLHSREVVAALILTIVAVVTLVTTLSVPQSRVAIVDNVPVTPPTTPRN